MLKKMIWTDVFYLNDEEKNKNIVGGERGCM
jgi:hypothetical protein